MGLIKAIGGAMAGGLADQWRDFFSCDSLDANTLVVKGIKQQGQRGSNTKGSQDVISNGSVVAVAPGQCALITQQGAIVEVCAEPGEYTWDSSSEPSLFWGKLSETVPASFERFGRRIGFGGDTGRDQRIYFINTKEVPGNRYGTAAPIPFRVVDRSIGLDMDISLRCSGEYSYRIDDPLLFFKNVAGNVEDSYGRGALESQLRAELLGALQAVLAQVSAEGVRYSELPGRAAQITSKLSDELREKWLGLRGIRILSFGINTVSPTEEDMQRVKDLQATAVMRDAGMRTAGMASAQMDAMRAAAGNDAGAMTGFMGMLMANAAAQGVPMGFGQQAAGGAGTAGAAGQQASAGAAGGCASAAGGAWATGGAAGQQARAAGGCAGASMAGSAGQQAGAGAAYGYAGQQAGAGAGAWTCGACGATNTGRFCGECGAAKPAPATAQIGWTCSCGATNTSKFCTKCGSPRPAAEWRCSCGAVNPAAGKFCGECGKPRA